MAKPVEFDYPRKNTKYDAKRKKWTGWQIDVYINQGKNKPPKRRRPVYPTLEKANAAELALRVESQDIRLGIKKPVAERPITLQELFEKKLENIAERKKKEVSKRVFNYYLALLPPSILVNELTTAHLKMYELARAKDCVRGKRGEKGARVQPQTIDREITPIRATLKEAGEYFPELENWICPRFPRPEFAESRREMVIDEEDEIKILAHFARPRQKNESAEQYRGRLCIGLEFEFAILTSSRRKEVVMLKWTDYVPSQNLLKIKRWKTSKKGAEKITNFSPLPQRVLEILKIRRAQSSGDYIFSKDGRDTNGYREALELACGKLGIPYGRFTDGGLTFHDTRHTFVSRLVNAGIDIETVRELSGLSRDMILRYAHSSSEQKRRAVAVLDGKSKLKNAREIYDKIKNGQMTFEDFEMTLRSANLEALDISTPIGKAKKA